jgi:uncharacterized protein (TIGR00369 family)
VRARIDADERHHQPYGVLHGGVYCAIVEDVASHGAGQLALSRGARGVLGVSNQTDFLRSHSRGELQAIAEPLFAGRTQHLWEVKIRRSSDEALVARGQVRFTVLQELPAERSTGRDR